MSDSTVVEYVFRGLAAVLVFLAGWASFGALMEFSVLLASLGVAFLLLGACCQVIAEVRYGGDA